MNVSDISLTTSMRNNIFALQDNARLVDRTEVRLATGKRVNSPLDNPTNYFAAASHISRASDLNSYKDSMLEAVQLLKVTETAINAMIEVLGQASAIADSAKTIFMPDLTEYIDQFNELLHQVDLISADATYRGAGLMRREDVTLDIGESSTLTLPGFDGTTTGYNGSTGLGIQPASTNPMNIAIPTVAKDSTGAPKVVQISSTPVNFQAIDIWLGNAGKQDIMLVSQDVSVTSTFSAGGAVSVNMLDNVAVAENGTTSFSLFRDMTASAQITTGNGTANSTILNTSEVSTFLGPVEDSAINTFTLSYDGFTWTANNPAVVASSGAGNTINLALNGNGGTDLRVILSQAQVAGAAVDVTVTSSAWQSSAPGIAVNGPSGSNGTISIDLGGNGSQDISLGLPNGAAWLSVERVTVSTVGPFRSSVPGASLHYDSTAQTVAIDLDGGAGNDILVDLSGGGWAVSNLPGDPSGNGDTISLMVDGRHRWLKSDLQSPNPGGMDFSKQEIEEAIGILRGKMTELGSFTSIINARMDFTDKLSSTLIEGGDNLTLADMNAEGANMLMLQTRENLGIISLSLSAESAQSVVKLFI